MKAFLFLLLIASCGKHTEPAGFDFQDNDGDQVLNYQEKGDEKDFANIPEFGPVSGILRIYGEELIEVPVANDISKKTALDLITRPGKRMLPEDYFSEADTLKLQRTLSIAKLSRPVYKVEIVLERTSELRAEVILKSEKGDSKFTPQGLSFTDNMSIESLRSLSEGESKLCLRKRFSQSSLFQEDSQGSIREKTYRVHFYDGQKSSTLYVSKSLSFSRLLEKFGITKADELNDLMLFDITKLMSAGWYYRTYSNGDLILVKGMATDLQKDFLKHFRYNKTVLSRVNGLAANKIALQNLNGAKIFFKFKKSMKTERTFWEQTVRTEHRRGGGGGGGREGGGGNYENWSCFHNLRRIREEKTFNVSLDYLLNEIEGMNNIALRMEDSVLENENTYTMLASIEDAKENLEFSFRNLPAQTYTTTGEFAVNCQGYPVNRIEEAQKTNAEGELKLEIETYTEII